MVAYSWLPLNCTSSSQVRPLWIGSAYSSKLDGKKINIGQEVKSGRPAAVARQSGWRPMALARSLGIYPWAGAAHRKGIEE